MATGAKMADFLPAANGIQDLVRLNHTVKEINVVDLMAQLSTITNHIEKLDDIVTHLVRHLQQKHDALSSPAIVVVDSGVAYKTNGICAQALTLKFSLEAVKTRLAEFNLRLTKELSHLYRPRPRSPTTASCLSSQEPKRITKRGRDIKRRLVLRVRNLPL